VEPAIAGIDNQVVFGLLGIAAGLFILYQTWRAGRNLGSHSDASIAMLLPEERVERSLFVLTASFLVLIVGMFVGAFGVVRDHAMLDTISRIGVGIGIGGLSVFLATVQQATSEREFDDLVGSIVEYTDERASHRTG
jgi:hypothetical protein